VIEEYSITGMGHGTPIAAAGKRALGNAGPFMLNAGISSTRCIAGFWGIVGDANKIASKVEETLEGQTSAPGGTSAGRMAGRHVDKSAGKKMEAEGSGSTGVRQIIEDALRAAGLMRW
jgi:hypothetical protein